MANAALHLCLISVHGLIRGQDPELGRDADTGGQVLYVIELARALVARDDVARVDLITRLIDDAAVAPDYARPEESLGGGAHIVRIPAGGPDYIPKERLWDHLDVFADTLLDHYRDEGSIPDLVHSHYADAGYVGARIAHVLSRPLVHTGHSLGRVKRRRLLAAGVDLDTIESRYAMSRRVRAEERTLAAAARVIASTHQEVEVQYGLYDFYRPQAMQVIPPGTDLSRFHPPQGDEHGSSVARDLHRFLRDPDKPMILALSRADPRKNIAALVHAYGRDPALQERANLVVVMGNRDDVTELEDGARDVLTELLQLIDRYDLYGRVAYPKQHQSDDVPVLYRLATLSGGVFVNPALTEPFGLTLIEAAASGLPVVATEDGGPSDIVVNCENGILVDPLDPDAIARAIRDVIDDWEGWQRRSASGLRGVRENYVWCAHAEAYLTMIRPLVAASEARAPVVSGPAQMPFYADRLLVVDLNGGLLGDDESLTRLLELLRANRRRVLFGISTGLRFDAALRLMNRHAIPEPDFLVTSTGTSITYAPKLTEDIAWARRIERQWTPQVVRRVLADVPGLALRESAQQSDYKISYAYHEDEAPPVDGIRGMLFKEEQAVNVILSHGRFLNVLPIRASKGLALRYIAGRWHIPLERVLAIGGSAADESMMRGNTLAAIAGEDAREELAALAESERIHFTRARAAAGILEAIDWYDFLGRCEAPAGRASAGDTARHDANTSPAEETASAGTDRPDEGSFAESASSARSVHPNRDVTVGHDPSRTGATVPDEESA